MPKLTAHFSREEMTFSETAVRHGINNKPAHGSRQNLVKLCENILEPIREIANGPITETSDHRPPTLNSIIAGASDSQHKTGKRLTSTARYSIRPQLRFKERRERDYHAQQH